MNTRGAAKRLALVLIAAGAALFSSNFLLDMAFAQEQDWTGVVSVLEVSEGHPRAMLRVTDILCGVLVVALLPYVSAALPPGTWRRWAVASTVGYAVAGAGAALVPLPCAVSAMCTSPTDDVQRLVHDGFSVVAQVALFVAVVAVALATRRQGPRWLNRAAWMVFLLGGVLGAVVSGYYGLTDPDGWQAGLAQRFQLVVISAWLVCLGAFAATSGVSARRRGTS
ncbi:MAG: DUF998 domain-containing protein [Ornithinimicrobium sp.]